MKITFTCSGFTLIEVMIAVFILTVCLLGFTGVYINVLKNTQNTYRASVENLCIQCIQRPGSYE